MYCGIVLSGAEEQPCGVACVEDETVETLSTVEDAEIIDFLEERRPIVIALNAPPEHVPEEDLSESPEESDLDEHTAQQFRKGEEELVNEGFSILPQEMRDRNLLERAEYLATGIKGSGVGAEIIESHPRIAMEKLDIGGDADLDGYGIETGTVRSAREFEAVVLALVARLYDEDHYEDRDVIIPKEL